MAGSGQQAVAGKTSRGGLAVFGVILLGVAGWLYAAHHGYWMTLPTLWGLACLARAWKPRQPAPAVGNGTAGPDS